MDCAASTRRNCKLETLEANMKMKLVASAIAVTLLGSAAVLAQGQGPAQQAQAPAHPMTFFVASTVPGTGNLVKGFGDMPNEHDMLTGSDPEGRAWPAGFDTTCNNWTSDGTDHRVMLGHSDRQGGGNVSWNAAHLSRDCTKAGLIATGGAGHFYCFAIN